MQNELARHIAFVLRCSAAATGSYMLAQAVGLPHPVWAAMSGVIVSQENLTQTHNATVGRLSGTVIGIVIAVAVGRLLVPLHAGVAVQMAVAVALAAVVARRYPLVRVCMWTCPIVFLSDQAMPLLMVGFYRGAEVLLGGLIGAALHWISERIIAIMAPAPLIAPEKPPVAMNLED
ncbi:FUSC family protein [Terracidiphilus gabretensis]|jgi:uncharacterized membrane protein YccC|uniref:FUSC family protein n=1 Tax=Terracidiphilus gabretensis TaxID=1577687 RepID=UPI00071B8C8E|nr:FUSC family protein [Terracidiphilus gabretensis]